MTIDDSSLSRFALGITPAAGVLLAIFVTLYVVLYELFATRLQQGFERFLMAIYVFSDYFSANARPLIVLASPPFDDAMKYVIALAGTADTAEMPTIEVFRLKAQPLRAQIYKLGEAIGIRNEEHRTSGQEESLTALGRFLLYFSNIEHAVRGVANLRTLQNRVLRGLLPPILMSGILLVAGSITALSAETDTGRGVSDSFNVVVAASLLVLLLLLLSYLLIWVLKLARGVDRSGQGS